LPEAAKKGDATTRKVTVVEEKKIGKGNLWQTVRRGYLKKKKVTELGDGLVSKGLVWGERTEETSGLR